MISDSVSFFFFFFFYTPSHFVSFPVQKPLDETGSFSQTLRSEPLMVWPS